MKSQKQKHQDHHIKPQSPKVTSQCKYCLYYRGKKRGCSLSYCDFEEGDFIDLPSKKARG